MRNVFGFESGRSRPSHRQHPQHPHHEAVVPVDEERKTAEATITAAFSRQARGPNGVTFDNEETGDGLLVAKIVPRGTLFPEEKDREEQEVAAADVATGEMLAQAAVAMVSPLPSAPSASVPVPSTFHAKPVDPLAKALIQLADMGFTNQAQNEKLLRQNGLTEQAMSTIVDILMTLPRH